jgi:hypothetical protein
MTSSKAHRGTLAGSGDEKAQQDHRRDFPAAVEWRGSQTSGRKIRLSNLKAEFLYADIETIRGKLPSWGTCDDGCARRRRAKT